MEESLSVLAEAKDCKEDQLLVTLVKIQLVIDRVYHARRDGDPLNPLSFYLNSFQTQLEAVKSQIPLNLQKDSKSPHFINLPQQPLKAPHRSCAHVPKQRRINNQRNLHRPPSRSKCPRSEAPRQSLHLFKRNKNLAGSLAKHPTKELHNYILRHVLPIHPRNSQLIQAIHPGRPSLGQKHGPEYRQFNLIPRSP